MFIHDALEELITCGETAIRAPELRSAINALSTVDPDTANTAFEDQFKVLLSSSLTFYQYIANNMHYKISSAFDQNCSKFSCSLLY